MQQLKSRSDVVSHPASQIMLEQRRDESRRYLYTRKIPHIYAL